MKKFENPEVEVISFTAEDIMKTSGTGDMGPIIPAGSNGLDV